MHLQFQSLKDLLLSTSQQTDKPTNPGFFTSLKHVSTTSKDGSNISEGTTLQQTGLSQKMKGTCIYICAVLSFFSSIIQSEEKKEFQKNKAQRLHVRMLIYSIDIMPHVHACPHNYGYVPTVHMSPAEPGAIFGDPTGSLNTTHVCEVIIFLLQW